VKHILPLMLEGAPEGAPWVEPFVGSAGVLAEVPPDRPRIGWDANPFLISLLIAVRDGWEPPAQLSERDWRDLRRLKDDYDNAATLGFAPLVAFAGFACSYAARWFEGYARDPKGNTNFAANGRKALLAARPKLQGADFYQGDYTEAILYTSQHHDGPFIIYCDPPYEGSAKNYYAFGDFNAAEFWDCCLTWAEQGDKVYVSSYEAPANDRIRCVWEKERAVSLTKDSGALRKMDRLFEVLP
jgi:DNA adenine methylase